MEDRTRTSCRSHLRNGRRSEHGIYAIYGVPARKLFAEKVQPGARTTKSPSPDGDDYVFEIDSDGRPLRVHYSHTVNRTDWEGGYLYGPDEVEHIEFCKQTGVPSLYNRLVLSDSFVIAEQRFVCNSGGSGKLFTKGTPAEKANRILEDPHGHFISITRFHIENGATKSAEELHVTGGSVYKPTREYIYADNALQRIVQHRPEGEQRTLFAARTKKRSLRDLSEVLSEKIADAVLAHIRDAAFGSRLIALELNYREYDRPIPHLIPLTEEDSVDSLALAAEIKPNRWIALVEEDFVPEITEFTERVKAKENVTAIPKMLRKAATLVTQNAPSLPCTADGFVAYAIEWEIEGDQIRKILKQCGAPATRMKEWTFSSKSIPATGSAPSQAAMTSVGSPSSIRSIFMISCPARTVRSTTLANRSRMET